MTLARPGGSGGVATVQGQHAMAADSKSISGEEPCDQSPCHVAEHSEERTIVEEEDEEVSVPPFVFLNPGAGDHMVSHVYRYAVGCSILVRLGGKWRAATVLSTPPER